MNKKSEAEKQESNNWYDDFVNYVIEKWSKNGTVSDEDSTRENLDAMLFLLSNYRLKCLMSTLVELDDLMEEFNNEHPEYFENGVN